MKKWEKSLGDEVSLNYGCHKPEVHAYIGLLAIALPFAIFTCLISLHELMNPHVKTTCAILVYYIKSRLAELQYSLLRL